MIRSITKLYFIIQIPQFLIINIFLPSISSGSIRNIILASLSILVGVSCILLFNKDIRFNKKRKNIVIFFAFYIFVGAINGNHLGYIVSDFVLLFIPFLMYYVSNNYKFSLCTKNDLVFAFILINVSLLFHNKYIGILIHAEFIFLITSALLIIGELKNNKPLIIYLLVSSFIIILFLSGKRSLLLLMVIIITYIISNGIMNKKLLKRTFIASIIVVLIATVIPLNYFVDSISYRKIKGFWDRTNFYELFQYKYSLIENADYIWMVTDLSTGLRIYELLIVTNELAGNNSLILGKGLGASFDLSNTKDKSIAIRRKNPEKELKYVRGFHLAPTWLLAKFGIMGISCILLFVFNLREELIFYKYQESSLKYIKLMSIGMYSISIFITFASIGLLYYYPLFLGHVNKMYTPK